MKVLALIDGFNFYHHILRASDPNSLKWLDYRSLCSSIIGTEGIESLDIYFFTAKPKHLGKDKVKRHETYSRALNAVNIHVKDGNFKIRNRKCRASCKEDFNAFEEKETDVNIAVYLIDFAYQDSFDTCLLFSCDSDLASAIEIVKKRFPKKKIKLIIPPKAGNTQKMCSLADSVLHLKWGDLRNNQLPQKLEYKGHTITSPYLDK